MQASSFAPLEAVKPPAPTSRWHSVVSAMDGAAILIPFSIGSVTLVFNRVGTDLIAAGVFATLLTVVWIHATTLASQRPMLYSARFFEATMMAAMMDQSIARLSSWGLVDTIGVRLAFMCLIGAGAGLVVGLLYLLRAGRFTRFIPAPVFAGFYNAIALALVISQSRSLIALVSEGPPVVVVASVAGAAAFAAFAVRRWRPRWPAAALGLAAGLVMGLGWMAAGQSSPVVIAGGWTLVLPVFLADFGSLFERGVETWGVAWAIALNAATLGTMLFVNSTMTAQSLRQAEGQRAQGPGTSLAAVAGIALGGLAGAAPVSGSIQASAAATRTSRLTAGIVALCAAVTAVVYFSGILGWIPLAAVCGALLREAWFMVDRGSLRLLVDWVMRRPLADNAREDLALVTAVTAAAVIFNMVVAVVVGLLLGLALFAVRNAKRPVRHVWSGAELSSNCARSRTEMKVLAEHPGMIRVFELEGDLFFGAAESVERSLLADSEGAACIILDWTRVRHVDSSLALTVANFVSESANQGQEVIHAGAALQSQAVGAELRRYMSRGHFERDLDHALEHAENQVIEQFRASTSAESTAMLDAMPLFNGLDGRQRAKLQNAMAERLVPRGAEILGAGDTADELVLILHGSASILVPSPDGEMVRLAGVRRGGIVGEIAFLDQEPRSASVVAQEDVVAAVLSRETYNALCETEPQLVRQLLANIALDVATRLRRTNQLALARTGVR